MTAEWMETAACRGKTDVMFLPAPQRAGQTLGATYMRAFRSAQEVCVSCPHTGRSGPCVAYAMTLPAEQRRQAVWGGAEGTELVGRVRAVDRAFNALVESGPVTAETLGRSLGVRSSASSLYLRQLVDEGRVVRWEVSGNGAPLWAPVGVTPRLEDFPRTTATEMLARLRDGPCLLSDMFGADKASRQAVRHSVVALERKGLVVRRVEAHGRVTVALTVTGERMAGVG